MQIGADVTDQRWTKRLDFAALVAWLILGVILCVISYVNYGEDFRGYYAAARVLSEGGN